MGGYTTAESLALGVLSFTMYGTTTEVRICWLGWLAGWLYACLGSRMCMSVCCIIVVGYDIKLTLDRNPARLG